MYLLILFLLINTFQCFCVFFRIFHIANIYLFFSYISFPCFSVSALTFSKTRNIFPCNSIFFLFAANRDHHRKAQPTHMQSCGTQSQWIHLQHTCTPKAQGTFLNRGQKECKSQKIRLQ